VNPKGRDRAGREDIEAEEWLFPFEAELHAVSPGLHDAQSAWMSQIDSLRAPDRKTHELIRLVCTVIRRNPPGVARHAMLAAEVGASWEEVAGSIVLTEPAFGLLNVVEALPWARRGWERGRRMAPLPGGAESVPPSARSARSPKAAPPAKAAKGAPSAKAAEGAPSAKAAKAAKTPTSAKDQAPAKGQRA
jgi:hypothetical protein